MTEMILRKLLWLRHGCPISALYGDDGEMQCNHCMIDFKRLSAGQIERQLLEEGLRKHARLRKYAQETTILAP